MTETVNEILAQGLPVQVLAVAVDVVVRHLVKRIGPVPVSLDLPTWNESIAACCAPSTML
jgi:hypothetical protein